MTLGEARIYVIAPAHVRAGRLADLIETLGADIVQLRDRSLTPAALLAEARACATAARRAGCLFVVNDDPVLARDAGADGVHLGQDDGSIAAAREIMGGGIVGRTTRGGDALAAGRRRGRRLRQRLARLGDRHAPDAAGGRPRSGRRRPRHRAAVVRARWHRRAPRSSGSRPSARAGSRWCAPSPRPTTRPRSWPLCGPRSTARPRVLTVAGSDSGGGAGIQADIKAISRAGGFPLVAVTALTAQTTTGVHGVVGTPPAFVRDQIRAGGGRHRARRRQDRHARHAGDGGGRRRGAGRARRRPTRSRSSSTR